MIKSERTPIHDSIEALSAVGGRMLSDILIVHTVVL